jgi:hypothetical protein
MGRDRIPKLIRQVQEKYWGSELVGDAEEARLLREHPIQLKWRRGYNREAPNDIGIFTPRGWLEARSIGGAFSAYRNDEPLCHATCGVEPGCGKRRWPSMFFTRAAAQAAAEMNLAKGWGDYERKPDCLAFEWQTRPEWERPPQITREVCASDIEDEYRFDLEELRRLCHPWGYPIELTSVAKQLHRPPLVREKWAQFDGQPAWRRDTHGWFSLKTPYGELVVRRENNTGWVAERNGTPLRYLSVRSLDCRLSDVKIVFDNYLDAQTRALLWSFYPEKDRLINWYNLPQPASPAA